MTTYDRRRYEMLARVRDFGTNHGHCFPDSTLAAQAFACVDAAVKELERYDLTRLSASVAARIARKAAARQALIDFLLKMAHTARVVAQTNPVVEHQFDLSPNVADRALLTVARQFASDAAPLTADFVAHGMPETFPTELERLIGAYETAFRERGMSRDQQVAARARIKSAIASALDAVRRLDVIVANHLGSDPVVQAVWQAGRRLFGPRKAPDRRPGAEPAAAATQA